MEISLLVAKVLGVYLVVSGCFLIFKGKTLPHLLADGENAPPFEGGDESPPRNSRAAALRGMRVAASAPGGALFV